MDDPGFLKKMIAHKKDSIEFFSDKHKADREHAITKAFLCCLGIPFKDIDIGNPLGNFPDATFKDAAFEIKELLDPGRRRHSEYKDDLVSLERAQDASALIEPYEPPEEITLDGLAAEIDSVVRRYSKYSPNAKASTDLLIYFNRQFATINDHQPLSIAIDHGWRSISTVGNGWAIVLSATAAAPDFISGRRGELIRNPRSWS